MTPDQLAEALDAMAAAAGPNLDLMPGLITVKDVEWVPTFYVLKEECRTLDDGVRHRNIKIAISSTLETRVLTRADAGERGQPYRDLAPRS
ncbi:hypothetical protein [Brevundimonas bullata]|jgi:hypothetical protein|uniref:hypothetical protein n=1 Tax=Brevundimonas bullata TaxID=13160 RepID=UPI003D9A8346